jgi:exopolysaccharide biosynthesis polyprenyl glycosylphosphotransferase
MALTDLGVLALMARGFADMAADAAPVHFEQCWLVFACLAAFAAWSAGGGRLYTLPRLLTFREALMRATLPFLAAVASLVCALAIFKTAPASLLVTSGTALALGVAMLAATRACGAWALATFIANGRMRYRVAIVGSRAGEIAATMASVHSRVVEIVGLYHQGQAFADDPADAIDSLLLHARRERLDAIVIGYPAAEAEQIRAVFSALRSSVADIFISTDIVHCGVLPEGHPLIGLPVLPAQRRALSDPDMVLKGLFDRIAGLIVLAIVAPLLGLVALAIKIESAGPVLFCQPRVGYNNVHFKMYKFRSMYHERADILAHRQTVKGDARVTRVGRIIRKLSIDELPQLLNVIRGEMSLVGPRPHAPGTNIDGLLLEHVAAGYPLRHRVLPGITGWAQINGSRGILLSPQHISERVALDLHYIDNWSLALDMKILALTAARELITTHAF